MFLACTTMRRVISCITVVDQSALARRRKGIDMQLLNLQAVLSLLMVSRTTLHKLRQVDGFPPPAVRCGKVLRWRQDDVLGWIEAQAKKEPPRRRNWHYVTSGARDSGPWRVLASGFTLPAARQSCSHKSVPPCRSPPICSHRPGFGPLSFASRPHRRCGIRRPPLISCYACGLLSCP